MTRLRVIAPFAAAAALGALAVFGFAPERLFVLSPLALGALFLLWERTASRRGAFALGFSFGAGFFGFGVWWIFIALHQYAYLPAAAAAAATGLFCAILAPYPAAALMLARVLAPSRRFWRGMVFAAAWTLCEWLRGWLFTGFPWLALGYSQIPESPLSGWMPLFGIYGQSLLVAAVGVCAALLVSRRAGGGREKAAAAGLIVLLVGGGGLLKQVEWSGESDAPPLAVSLLQGDISQSVKLNPAGGRESLDVYSEMAREARGDLVILPETALPFYLRDIPPAYLAELGGDKTVLVGLFARDDEGRKYNAALAIAGDAPPMRYYKRHLVPYGEYVPFSDWVGPLIAAFRIPFSDLSSGPRRQILRTGAAALGVMICYEDAFGEEAADHLPEAELLVNMTNDAWYGESRMLAQHLQMSQARALELARPLARAANNGVTAMIDHRGEITAAAAVGARAVVEATAVLRVGATPFALFRNWPTVIFVIAVLAAAVFARRRARRGGDAP